MSQNINFKELATIAVTLSPLMNNAEPMKTDDVLRRDLTIIDFDLVPKFDQAGNPVMAGDEQDVYSVVKFDEEPGKYYCGGLVLTKICKAWADRCGDIASAATLLKESGGVTVRFEKVKTRTGNTLVTPVIL